MRNRLFFYYLIIAALGVSLTGCNENNQVKQNTPAKEAKDGFPSDSFAYYEQALKADSLNIPLRLALANNYYVKLQYEKAIDHLLKICSIDDKNTVALITLGNIYYDTEQYQKGIEYYEKALALDGKNVNVRCDLATCYLNLKKPEKALALLKKNIALDYNHAQSHHNLSVVYKEMGKLKEADEEMKLFESLQK